MDEQFCNRVGRERISGRQIDELIGITRGLTADGQLNQAEIEFLQKWLAANSVISDQPVIHTLYRRVDEVLHDGFVDGDECAELLETLNQFSDRDFELGEVLKSTSLPLCYPSPRLSFPGVNYCFTGTFNFGTRQACHDAVEARGAAAGSLNKSTDVLVIGVYATESWRHSSFGNKIMKAAEWRENGVPISIVSEEHWQGHL
jgi:NAD-dependent DNA ligase